MSVLTILGYNCSNQLDMRNFQEQVRKEFCNTEICSDLSLFE